MGEKIVFCKGGGCTAKLGAGVLERVLERLPEGNKDERLLAAVEADHASATLEELQAAGLPASIIGEITEKSDREILCRM